MPPSGTDTSQLTAKQARFVEEYLIDLNATRAYRVVYGVSQEAAEASGSRLLGNVKVQAAIEARRQEIAANTSVTPERVIQELGRIGFSDMRDFATWGPNGVTMKASADLTPDAAACVAEVSETPGKYGETRKVKLYDKVAALTQLGRHFGLFTDKIEDVSKLPREERRERLLKLLA